MTNFPLRLASFIAIAAPLIILPAPGWSDDADTPASTSAKEDSVFSEKEEDAIRDLVRDYIIANPSIIVEALERAEELAELQKELEAQLTLIDKKDEIYNDKHSFVAGNPEGDVTIVEFFDYNCGFCRRATPALLELIETDPGIRVVFKEFPVLGKDSDDVSRLMVAVTKQDQYLALHNQAMLAEGDMNLLRIEKMAKDAGLDMGKLKKDMESDEVTKILSDNFEIAQRLYLTGTPSFIVGDRIVRGWPGKTNLLAIIDEVRNPPTVEELPPLEDEG